MCFHSTLDNCSCLGFKTEVIDLSCWFRLYRSHKLQFLLGFRLKKLESAALCTWIYECFSLVDVGKRRIFADPRYSAESITGSLVYEQHSDIATS